MKLYPWLIPIYKKIIQCYKIKKLHHTILIESYNINNSFIVIWKIIKWIFCKNKKNMEHCRTCASCKFFFYSNHPDCYILTTKKKNEFIESNYIKQILEKISHTSQHHNKIIWIPDYCKLTIFGINMLLKIIEEPPKNTFFFIGKNRNQYIEPTLLSRCLQYNINKPNIFISLKWLQKNTKKKKKKIILALKIKNNNPEYAIWILKKKNWILRNNLYNQIQYAINNKNFIILLSILNTKYIFIYIYWIITFLLDILKFKKNFFMFLKNIDFLNLIKKISYQYHYNTIYKILYSWIKCRNILINNININKELLILQQLLKWEIYSII